MPSVNLRTFFYALALVGLLIGPIGTAPNSSYAQGEDNLVTFAQLYKGERTLRGPESSTSIGFHLPAHWEVTDGGKMSLSFTVVLFGSSAVSSESRPFTGVLQVKLNDIKLGSATVNNEGLQSTTFPIPMDTWAAVRSSGLHDITIHLITNDECDGASILTILSNSTMLVPHRVVSPHTDLRLLPQPIYQDSLTPDMAVLVMPDQPTAGELQAALTTIAGFARMSSGKLELTYVTAKQLNVELLRSTHLIFVGKPSAFPQLAEATWPAPVSGGDFQGVELMADDGILQMVVSPWNETKVVLLVSGQSDAGVIKASQAVGSGLIRTGSQTGLAVVAEAQTKRSTGDINTPNWTLAKLGYGEEMRSGPSSHTIEYRFEIPPGHVVSGDGYLDLIFANSALLDFEQSGLSVSLNGEFAGSVRFIERSTTFSNAKITIPRAMFRTGRNVLLLRANLEPRNPCARSRENALWMVVRPESILHVPLSVTQTVTRTFDLSTYPSPFVPTLEHMAFVVADDDLVGWNVAAQLAFDLGRSTEGTLISPLAVYANAVPDTIRQQRDLLVIGRPSTLPILSELRKALPVPFDPGSDIANEPSSELKFRVPKDTPLGYLEILPAPWNAERTIVAVLGNGEQGLRWASIALMTPSLREKLTGNFAVVNGEQIIPLQTATQAKATATPVTSSAQPQTPGVRSNISDLNLTVIGIVGAVIFVLLAVLLMWQRKRKA